MELTLAPRLLSGIKIKGRVVTLDALPTQRKTAEQALEQGGDYFMVVKENQPKLSADIKLLFDDPPLGEVFAGWLRRGQHGDRFEERELVASTALNWPEVGQACRIERRVTRKEKTSLEVRYAVTSLKPKQASPERLQQ